MERDTYVEAKKQAKELADRVLANHVVETDFALQGESFGSYVCNQPGKQAYWYRVVTAPYSIILLGDIEELILCCNDEKSLDWLRHAVGSHDYLWGKVAASMRHKVFYPQDARDALRRWREEFKLPQDRVDEIVENWTVYGEDDVDAWSRAIYETTGDAELADEAFNPPFQFHFQCHALKRFIQLLDQSTLKGRETCPNF